MQPGSRPNLPADRPSRLHAQVFLVLILALLISFVTVPGLTLNNLGDQFRWRRDLVKVFTSFRYALGDRLFNNTLVGKQGWLYYDGGLSFREYQRTDPIGQKSLRAFQAELDQVNATLAAGGQTLLLVIPPNKTSIYPQYMPDQVPVIGKASRLDQFMAYMRAHSDTQILDLRDALISASQTQQTYYRTDSHWNDVGAYYAYYSIVSALAQNYPRLKPHPISDYSLSILKGAAATDLPPSMGYLTIPEDLPVLEPRFPVSTDTITEDLADGTQLRLTTNQRSDLPRVLIFSDSFYGSLEKFLKPDFSQIVDLPYWAAGGGSLYDWVAYVHPDIVIIECVERDLENLFPLLEGIRK